MSYRRHLYPAKIGLALALASIFLYFFFNLWPLVFSIGIAFTNAREGNMFVNPEKIRSLDNAIMCVDYLKSQGSVSGAREAFQGAHDLLEDIYADLNGVLRAVNASDNPRESPDIYLNVSRVFQKSGRIRLIPSTIASVLNCSRYGFETEYTIVSPAILVELDNVYGMLSKTLSSYSFMNKEELVSAISSTLHSLNKTKSYFSRAVSDFNGFLEEVRGSFAAEREASSLKFVGLSNFSELFGDPRFYYSLSKTFLFVATSVPLKVFMGFSLALLYSSNLIVGRKLLRGLILAPWAIPILLSGLTWRFLFQPSGQLGYAFKLEIFSREWDAFLVYNIFEAWLAYPFIMTVTMGALSSISREVLEASYVDGASLWLRVRRVVLPLIARPLAIATILTTGASLQAFLVPLLINGGGPTRTIEVPGIGSRTGNLNELLILFGYNRATIDKEWGYAAATYLAIVLIIVVYVGLWFAISKRGERRA